MREMEEFMRKYLGGVIIYNKMRDIGEFRNLCIMRGLDEINPDMGKLRRIAHSLCSNFFLDYGD
ncbi:MAG: hypothetical protein KKF68_00560 [Nanoarchaeota archaeon]|nr:hypothetical protein [Nanoarchaeota archaeon]